MMQIHTYILGMYAQGRIGSRSELFFSSSRKSIQSRYVCLYQWMAIHSLYMYIDSHSVLDSLGDRSITFPLIITGERHEDVKNIVIEVHVQHRE